MYRSSGLFVNQTPKYLISLWDQSSSSEGEKWKDSICVFCICAKCIK